MICNSMPCNVDPHLDTEYICAAVLWTPAPGLLLVRVVDPAPAEIVIVTWGHWTSLKQTVKQTQRWILTWTVHLPENKKKSLNKPNLDHNLNSPLDNV